MDYLYEGEGYFMIELATAIKEVTETSKMLSRLMPDYFKELPSAIGENIYDVVDLSEKKMLSMEEKLKIKEESDWSDEIVDQIKSMEEYEIYKEAELKSEKIEGRECLQRTDIDYSAKDPFGNTNLERMQKGLPPIVDGKSLELHHIGQKMDSPLAELKIEEHRGQGKDAILHDKTKETEIDRNEFKKERESHWKERAEQLINERGE